MYIAIVAIKIDCLLVILMIIHQIITVLSVCNNRQNFVVIECIVLNDMQILIIKFCFSMIFNSGFEKSVRPASMFIKEPVFYYW